MSTTSDLGDITGAKPREISNSTTNAIDYLIALNPSLGGGLYSTDGTRHTSTFVKTFKYVDGKAVAEDIDPKDIQSGPFIAYIGQKTGGDNRERVAQAYLVQDGKFTPIGDAKYYQGAKDNDFWTDFLIQGVLPMVMAAVPGFGQAVGAAFGATGAAATALGTGIINFGTQLIAGADPLTAIKNAVKTAGAGYIGQSIGSMLPAELQSVGRVAITQLIATGKINLASLAAAAGQQIASQELANQTGMSIDTARSVIGAGINALGGNEVAAIQMLGNAAVSGAIDALSTEKKFDPKEKALLQLGVSQAIQFAKTGQFNPFSLISQLQGLGFDKTTAAKVTGETAKEVPLSNTAIGSVSIDANGNLYSADDDGNRIMLTGASPGRTYTAEEWNGIQAGLNAGQSQFVSSLLKEMNNGVMSPDDVRYELGQAGYSAAQIQKIETANQQYIERSRQANQALEDYVAVGSDVSRESIVQRLQDLGYSAEDADRVIGNVDKQVLARNAYPNVARDFVQGNATEAQLRDAMEAAGIRGDTANDQLLYYRAVKAGDELTSSEATQAAVAGLRQWQVIDRKGTQISWAQNPEDGSYYVKAARDGTGKDITDTFLGATPQSIDKYRIEQQQQYVDRLSKQLTGTAERFFAPGSTMTEAQAISLLKQNDGMTDAMARQVVTGWNDQKAAIGRNSLGIDSQKQTTSRMLSFEEFEKVLGAVGVKDDLLSRYRSYQYTQGALYQAGKIKDGENPLPGEVIEALNKGKPGEPLPRNAVIDDIARTVYEGIKAGASVGSPAQNFINSLNANFLSLFPRAGAGIASVVTGDAANDVAVALRGIAEIGSKSSDLLMPELAAEANRQMGRISAADGAWNKLGAAWQWATESPTSFASLAWTASKELSEDMISFALMGKALKAIGTAPGIALGSAMSDLALNYGGIAEENIAQLIQDGLDPKLAAQLAGQGAMPAALAETIVGGVMGLIPGGKTALRQLIATPYHGAVDGLEEAASYVANQIGMGQKIDLNDALTSFVIAGAVGSKANIQTSVADLLSPQGQGQLIKNLDDLGYQVGIDPNLIPADVKGTVTSVIGNTAVISGPNNQTYVLDVSNQNLTKGSVLNIEGFDTKPVQLTTGQMDSLLSTIDGAYQNQIGRQATFDEISNNIQGVVGKSQSELEATLNQTVDGRNFDLVNSLYQNTLGRKPTQAELTAALTGLNTGALDETKLTTEIKSTNEYGEISKSASVSTSKATSTSTSTSVSVSTSQSLSASISASVSESTSKSVSQSVSVSNQISENALLAASVSNSISQSISASQSISTSLSTVASISNSQSESLSLSVSVEKTKPFIWASPNGTKIELTPDWEGLDAKQRIDYINDRGWTAENLQSWGVSEQDILAFIGVGLNRGNWTSKEEAAAASISKSLSASVSQSISQSASTSESISISTAISENALQAASISKSASESISVSVATSKSVSVSEAAVSTSKSVSQSVSEAAVSASKSTSQSLSASQEAVETSKSESISISKLISENVLKAVSVSNSISVSQSISTAASISASVSQSISTAQSLSASKSVSISESTSLSILEKQFLSEQISASKSESVSISKSLSASRSVSISESTSLSILDKQFISEQASISKSLSQSISTSLINSVSASKSASISTSVSVVESQGLSQLRNTSASISASISAAASISLSNSLSLSASISEEAERDIKENISASASVSLSQSAALDISSSISASKSASISEKLKNLDTSQRVSVSESISISESLSQSASASVSQSVSQSISQTVAPTISVTTSISQSISESISQTVSVSESISETVSQSITKQISETPSETISITFTPTLVITTPTPTVTVTETVTFTTPPPTIPWPPTLSYTETTSMPVTTTEAPTTTKPVTTKPVTTKPVTTPPPPFPLFMVPGYDQTKRYIDYAQPNVPAPEFGPYDPFKAPNYLRPLQDSGNFGLAALVGAFDNASQPGNGGNQPK